MSWNVGGFSREQMARGEGGSTATDSDRLEEQLRRRRATPYQAWRARMERNAPGSADASEQRQGTRDRAAAVEEERQRVEHEKQLRDEEKKGKWDEEVKKGRAYADDYMKQGLADQVSLEYTDPESVREAVMMGGVGAGGERIDPTPDDGYEGYRAEQPTSQTDSFGNVKQYPDEPQTGDYKAADGSYRGKDGADGKRLVREDKSQWGKTPQTASVKMLGSHGQMLVDKAMELGRKYGFKVEMPPGYQGQAQVAELEKNDKLRMKAAEVKKAADVKQKKIEDGWNEVQDEADSLGYGERASGLRALYPDKPQQAHAEMRRDAVKALATNEKKAKEFEKKFEASQKSIDAELQKLSFMQKDAAAMDKFKETSNGKKPSESYARAMAKAEVQAERVKQLVKKHRRMEEVVQDYQDYQGRREEQRRGGEQGGRGGEVGDDRFAPYAPGKAPEHGSEQDQLDVEDSVKDAAAEYDAK